MRLDETNTVAPTPTSLANFYQKLLAKNVRRPDDIIMWPQMTFQREMMQQMMRAEVSASLAYLVMILGDLGRSDAH